MELFDQQGNRKYLVATERKQFEYCAREAANEIRTFCLLLYYTGARISEALNLLHTSIDYSDKCVIFECLKKRKKGVYRQVPVPDTLLDDLQMVHNIKKLQTLKATKRTKIWSWARNTAYLKVMSVMEEANISGIHACPKGLRHSFAIHCLEKGIPINLVSKWMGHSSLEVTAIYANALGEEERMIASRLWE